MNINDITQSNKQILSEFTRYLRPTVNQALTDFCIQLTGITQDVVDNGSFNKQQMYNEKRKNFCPGTSLDKCFQDFDNWLLENAVLEKQAEQRTTKLAIVTVDL